MSISALRFAQLSGFTAAALTLAGSAHAAQVAVTITVQNLAAPNSVAVAPLHYGFNSGVFDAFNIGGVAGAPIISVAEGGSGSAWQPAFAAADPTATRGTIGGGPLLPGATASQTVMVDSVLNPFFTFAAMVVPSNDFFIGNDSPTRFRVLNAAGNLLISSILQKSTDIWDAGSEVFDPAAAAFVGNNSLRTPQNSVVSFNFAELAAFNGLTTAAGYVLNSGLSANSQIYRISFSAVTLPVPEPQSYALMLAGLVGVGWVARRRRQRADAGNAQM